MHLHALAKDGMCKTWRIKLANSSTVHKQVWKAWGDRSLTKRTNEPDLKALFVAAPETD